MVLEEKVLRVLVQADDSWGIGVFALFLVVVLEVLSARVGQVNFDLVHLGAFAFRILLHDVGVLADHEVAWALLGQLFLHVLNEPFEELLVSRKSQFLLELYIVLEFLDR